MDSPLYVTNFLCLCQSVSVSAIVSVPLKVGTCVTLQYIVLQAADRIFTILIVPGRAWLVSGKNTNFGHMLKYWTTQSVCVGGWRHLSFWNLCLFVCLSVCLFVWFSIPILIPYNSLNNNQLNSLYYSQVYKKKIMYEWGGNVDSNLVKFRQNLKIISI